MRTKPWEGDWGLVGRLDFLGSGGGTWEPHEHLELRAQSCAPVGSGASLAASSASQPRR